MTWSSDALNINMIELKKLNGGVIFIWLLSSSSPILMLKEFMYNFIGPMRNDEGSRTLFNTIKSPSLAMGVWWLSYVIVVEMAWIH